MKNFQTAAFLATALMASALPAQEWAGGDEISSITLETLPDGTLLQGEGGIILDGDVTASGSVAVQQLEFPDGTVQATAGGGVGISANSGLYENRILDFVPSLPYSEICFKSGQVFGDIHVNSESTQGGNCLPGDLGWVIERNERSADTWREARVECLLQGMRLPEIFEFQYSCSHAASYGLNAMTDDWEWSSNSTIPTRINTNNGVVTTTAGTPTCNHASPAWLGTSDSGFSDSLAYRCLR
jgi:hypothetical protein